jgi:hypothetical protein
MHLKQGPVVATALGLMALAFLAWTEWLRHRSWLRHRGEEFAPGTQHLALLGTLGVALLSLLGLLALALL